MHRSDHSGRSVPFFVGVALASSLVLPAYAQVSITAFVSGNVQNQQRADRAGPQEQGSLLAQVIFPVDPILPPMTSRAGLMENGDSAVRLDGMYFFVLAKPEDTSPGPQTVGPQVLDGESRWSVTLTNTTESRQTYRYSFTLTPFQLELHGLQGAGVPGAPRAEYTVEVLRDGNVMFSSHARVYGCLGDFVFEESGTDLGGVSRVLSRNGIAFDFSQFEGDIPIGNLDPNESMTVTALLRGHTETSIINTGSRVIMGDPLDLKDDPGIESHGFSVGLVGVEPVGWGAVKDLYRH